MNTHLTCGAYHRPQDAIFLLQGESAYNFSLVGWGGHLPGGGVKASVKEVLETVRINTPEQVRKNAEDKCITGKVGLSIGLWFISEGVKKIGLDMVLPGESFGDKLMPAEVFVRKAQLSTQLPHP